MEPSYTGPQEETQGIRSASVAPAVTAEILVNPKFAVVEGSLRESWSDERDVPHLRNHRVLSVGPALAGGAGMGVNVGDHLHLSLSAKAPERAIGASRKQDHAIDERLRDQVVIVDHI